MPVIDRRQLIILGLTGIAAARIGHASADEPPLLTVTNAAGASTSFTRAQLEALPQRSIRTKTPWTEGSFTFDGPSLAGVLKAADATAGASLKLTALNAYAVDVPMSDVTAFDPNLAMRQDGTVLSIRKKGPLWLMYPMSDDPSLDVPIIHARLIWQVKTIQVS